MMNHNGTLLRVSGLNKAFTLHNQGGVVLEVLSDISFEVHSGECLVLQGRSGAGKSSLMRCLYANYLSQSGSVEVMHRGDWIDMASAEPHAILDVRRHTMGYVSQFLRAIPRVPTLEIVAEPLRRQGVTADEARRRAGEMLARLNIPESLWSLAPSTFSGGEQQRVNIAHCFVADYALLLLDEPTASLDADNRQVVLDLMRERLDAGTAIIGIFHDAAVAGAIGTRGYDVSPARSEAA